MTDVRLPPPPAGPRPKPRGDSAGPDATAPPAPRPDVAVLLLGLTIALVPLGTGWVLWAAPGGDADFNRRITLAPFDLALAALAVVWARQRLHAPRPRAARSPATLLVVLLVAAYAVAFAAHPSWRGVDLALRIVAGIAAVDVLRRCDRSSLQRLCALTVGAGAAQSLLGIAQVVHGRGLDLPPLDYEGPLFAFGGQHAARGGLSHPYHLVVFLLLGLFCGLVGGRHATGRARVLWAGGLALLGTGAALTFSRAMLLAVVPAGVALLLGARRARLGRAVRPLVLAFATGLACTALVVAPGWQERAGQSTAADADRGRVEKMRLGLEVAQDHALTGVGPGRYVLALADRDGVPDVDLLPAHNVVVHGLAELGLLGGSVLALALAAYALRVLRRGSLLALAGAWLLVPFVLLDAYAYVFPTGLVLTAVWFGLVEHPELRRGATPTIP